MKTLFTLLLVIFVSPIFAQIQQGSVRVGGDVWYYQSTTRYPNSTAENDFARFSVSPSVAYFPIDNLSIGITIPVVSYSAKYQTSTYSQASYELGPEVRYYIPFGKFAAFPEVIYSFGKTFTESTFTGSGDPATSETEEKTSSVHFGIGTTYFITPNVGLEAIVSYKTSKQEADAPISSSYTTDAVNFTIGLQIYLNRKNNE